MSITRTLSIIFALCTFPNLTWAAPQWVWRVDRRPPSEVFEHGFKAWGDNLSLRDHFSGRSCRFIRPEDAVSAGARGPTPDSAFISTTADRLFPHEYINQMNLQEGESVTVYEIRATTNFFSGVTALENLRQPFSTELRAARFASEWISTVPISPTQIRSAVTYQMDGRLRQVRVSNELPRGVDAATLPNRFVDLPTVGNDNVYYGAPTSAYGSWVEPNVLATPVSLCFSSYNSARSAPATPVATTPIPGASGINVDAGAPLSLELNALRLSLDL